MTTRSISGDLGEGDEAEEDNAVIEEERMDVDEVGHDEAHDENHGTPCARNIGGIIIEWDASGADKRFWVDEGWINLSVEKRRFARLLDKFPFVLLPYFLCRH